MLDRTFFFRLLVDELAVLVEFLLVGGVLLIWLGMNDDGGTVGDL